MQSLPPPGQLSQQSNKHLDLLFALAYPNSSLTARRSRPKVLDDAEGKTEENTTSEPIASGAAEAS